MVSTPVVRSILVVDDEEIVRDTLARILKKEGCHVTLASNGREALGQLLAGYLPNLIFLDLMMPEMDGFAFMRQIKQYRPYSEIPIVVTSALVPAESQHPPWVARLDKPYDLQGVRAALRLYAR